MSEVSSKVEQKDPAVLHYFHFRNVSVKLVKKGEKYIVSTKKYILYYFKWRRSYEFDNYFDAEDLYLDLKSTLQYKGRTY